MDLSDQFRHIGEDVTIWPNAKVVNRDCISIGNSVIIDDFVLFIGGNNTKIGDFVHIGAFSLITGGGDFFIADFAGISSGVKVFTGNEKYFGECLTNPTVPYPFREPIRSFVRIEKHTIVGANAVILPGVVLGEGCVVGANSLITKSCAPWTIYSGTPARKIGARPSVKMILLESELRKVCYSNDGSYIATSHRKFTERK